VQFNRDSVGVFCPQIDLLCLESHGPKIGRLSPMFSLAFTARCFVLVSNKVSSGIDSFSGGNFR